MSRQIVLFGGDEVNIDGTIYQGSFIARIMKEHSERCEKEIQEGRKQ